MKKEKAQKDKCKCPFCDIEVEFAFCKSCDKEFLECHICGGLVEKQSAVCSVCGWRL